jgi:purine-binding chemotaxis protein CheW
MNPNNEPHDAQVQLEQFVVFVLDEAEYAVPILAVSEVVPSIEITPVPGAPTYILGLSNLRGKVVPVLDLEKKFQLSRSTETVRQHIMIAESEQNALFGILVDQVEEIIKIPRDAIKPTPEMVKSDISAEYLGGVILLNDASDAATPPDERMLLILDLKKILTDTNVAELHDVTAEQTPIN